MEQMMTKEQAMASMESMAENRAFADRCENAYTRYKNRLLEEGRYGEMSDLTIRDAVSRAFFGAKDQAALDALMGRAPKDIADGIYESDVAAAMGMA